MVFGKRPKESMVTRKSVTVDIMPDLGDVTMDQRFDFLLASYQREPDRHGVHGLNLLRCAEVEPRHPKSLPVTQRVLVDAERRIGIKNGITLYAYKVLGDVLAANGNPAEAEKAYRFALKNSAKYFEERSSTTDMIRHALFLFLSQQNRLAEALDLHHSVKVSGVDQVGASFELAQLLDRADRLAEAIAEYQSALRLAESMLGRDHQQTMNIRTKLAMLAMDTQHPLAEQTQRDVIVDQERTNGPDSEGVLVARSNLAKLLVGLGRADEAASLYRDVLAQHERVLGPNHPGTLFTTANYGKLLFALDRDREAVALFRQLLPVALDVFGPNHPVTRDAQKLSH